MEELIKGVGNLYKDRIRDEKVNSGVHKIDRNCLMKKIPKRSLSRALFSTKTWLNSITFYFSWCIDFSSVENSTFSFNLSHYVPQIFQLIIFNCGQIFVILIGKFGADLNVRRIAFMNKSQCFQLFNKISPSWLWMEWAVTKILIGCVADRTVCG